MTIWSPRLVQSDAPLYRRIADHLAQDVERGVLLPGSRLPTQRELAKRLGVTVVTVTRAYSEAAERGLIHSTVGRGSFVREKQELVPSADAEIDLSTNVIQGSVPAMSAALAARIGSALMMPYGIGAGTERHRAAGVSWIARSRSDAHPSRLAVTAGAQQAIFLAFASLLEPGDVVLTEEVTYHWVKSVAELLHVKVEGVPIDRYGMLPDALAKSARRRNAKAVYITPTIHNPTGAVMHEKRRREIAATADQHGLFVIEDDVYGFLVEDAPPALSGLNPERALFLTGLGKSVAPALRIGYLLAPAALMPRIESLLNANSLFTSPVLAEIAASVIEDGTAARLAAGRRDSISARSRIVRRLLGRHAGSADERSPHLWIPLLQRWTSERFAAAAAQRGVRVASAAQFATTKNVPNAVRISIGAPANIGELEAALRVVDALREGEETTRASVV